MLKIKWSGDCLIFNMEIHIPGKDGLYIETGPRFQSSDWGIIDISCGHATSAEVSATTGYAHVLWTTDNGFDFMSLPLGWLPGTIWGTCCWSQFFTNAFQIWHTHTLGHNITQVGKQPMKYLHNWQKCVTFPFFYTLILTYKLGPSNIKY